MYEPHKIFTGDLYHDEEAEITEMIYALLLYIYIYIYVVLGHINEIHSQPSNMMEGFNKRVKIS